jgi:hypothetical protein
MILFDDIFQSQNICGYALNIVQKQCDQKPK